MLRQLRIELSMCGAIKLQPLGSAVAVTLIGIEEPDEPDVSEQLIRTFSLDYSPEPSSRVRRIGKTDPECRS